MQAPAPHAQTYAAVPIAPVEALCKEYDKLDQDITAAQNPTGGGFAKALPPTLLQQKVTRKAQLGPLIKQTLDTDIATIRRNYDRYAQGMETMRAMAKTRLDDAKKAVDTYQKSKKTTDLEAAVHATATIGREIQLLLDTAEQENKNFGGSWFAYRGFNPLSHAHNLDEQYVEAFLQTRTNMINESKMLTAKLQKFKELSTQAQALNKMSATLHAGGQQDAAAAGLQANKLAAKIDAEVQLIENGGTGLKLGWLSTKAKYNQLHQDAATQTKNKKTDLKVAEDRYSDAEAAVKIVKAKIKSLKVVLDAGVKSFTTDEAALPIVKAQIKHAKEEYGKTDAMVKEIATAQAQATKDITAMRKRCVN
jgi:hypothetical protein